MPTKPNRSPEILRTAAVSLALLILSSGCSHRLTLKAPPVPAASVAPVPVTVGVFYAPGLRSYRHEYHSGANYIFELGPPSVALLDQVAARTFARVVALHARPPLAPDGPSVDLILELEIESFVAQFRMYGRRGGTHAQIDYRATLYSPDAMRKTSWIVTGQVDKSGGSTFEFAWNMLSEATESAMQSAAQNLASDLRNPDRLLPILDVTRR
jgi:hypothetical protein